MISLNEYLKQMYTGGYQTQSQIDELPDFPFRRQ